MSSSNRRLDIHAHVKQAIYSMLCEDVSLETADQIYILAPERYQSTSSIDCWIADQKFSTKIIPRPNSNGRTPIVSLALGFGHVSANQQSFARFCFLLFSQFGRVEWGKEKIFYLFFETFFITVIPADNRDEVLHYSQIEWPTDEHVVIVTNKTLSFGDERRNLDQIPNLIHYSKFPGWLQERRQYGLWNK